MKDDVSSRRIGSLKQCIAIVFLMKKRSLKIKRISERGCEGEESGSQSVKETGSEKTFIRAIMNW